VASDDAENPLLLVLAIIAAYYIFRPSLQDREDYKAGYNAGKEIGHYNGYAEGIEQGKISGRDEYCGNMNRLDSRLEDYIKIQGICNY